MSEPLARLIRPLAHALILAVFLNVAPATAGADDDALMARIAAERARGEEEGWTFTIGVTPASARPMDELCGLVVPDDWWVGARFSSDPPRLGLPASFDWCDTAGCPPVRNQGSCGSCWAFATVGVLECNILIADGNTVDLSEQWLLSCNRSGYDCSGGWYAHEYHESQTDACGGTGAVLEDDFPYVAADTACNCPYDHVYTIDNWAYVGTTSGVPSTASIKQAILDHGPVSVGVRVDQAFNDYTGGVFNAHSAGQVNHAVVLVGWDDNQGADGVWILRNSWSPFWGDDGYMLIEYGCSSVGYAACYVEYVGVDGPVINVTPTSLDFGDVNVGNDTTLAVTVKNVGNETLDGTAGELTAPFSFVGSAEYSLAPGASQVITIRFTPLLQGTYEGTLSLTGGGGASVPMTGSGTGTGPSDNCADGPQITDGTFTGSTAAATTELAASCGGGGTADVWWRYTALQTGTLTLDTCGSDFDTVLSVYDACGGTELECNDDSGDCDGDPSASQVSLSVATSDTLYVRVAGCAGATGDVVLNAATDVLSPTIAGRITTTEGTAVSGVTLTGLPGSPVSDANGDYTTTVNYGFTGDATPQKTAYTFSPASIHYGTLTTDRYSQNYIATPPSFTLAGRITNEDDDPVPNVLLLGLPGTPLTDEDGQYHASVPLGFSGTATPTKTANTFTPTTRSYEDISSDLLFEDYEAEQWTGSLCVILAPIDVRAGGAQWRVDAGVWHDSGQTVTGLPIGTHTITCAALDGWSTPAAVQVTIAHAQTTLLELDYYQRYYTLTITGTSPAVGEVTASPAADASNRYLQDTVVTLTAVPVPGFRVSSWSGADEVLPANSSVNTVTMTSDRTVNVTFDVDSFSIYQLSASVSGDGGTLEPRRGTYREGVVVDLLATPDNGYQVRAWTGTDDDTSAANANAVTMDGHKTVRVEFEPWSDCNEDGLSDRLNIADGASDDCNDNGQPDECEVDSDGDGVIDDCEDVAPDDLLTVNPATPGGMCGFGIVETLAVTLAGLGLLKRRGT